MTSDKDMEATRDDVANAYRLLLGREPTKKETDGWAARNLSRRVLTNQFLKSAEFAKRYASLLKNTRPMMPEQRLLSLDLPRLVFIHIPKCGGTSFHAALAHWYGHDAIHPERFNSLYMRTAQDLASKTVFSGHFDFYSTNMIPGPKHLVTMMREPTERLISLYNFYLAHDPDRLKGNVDGLVRLAHRMDANTFFNDPVVRKAYTISNYMVRHLSNSPQVPRQFIDPGQELPDLPAMLEQATSNLGRFSLVGFTEHHDQAISHLAERLGLAVPPNLGRLQELSTLMETAPEMRRIEKQRPSPETLQGMEELVAHDRVLYMRAMQMFPPSGKTPDPEPMSAP